MLLKGVLFMHVDTWDHIDALGVAMERTKQEKTTRSDVVQWLVLQHWKKMQVRKAKKQAEKTRLVLAP